MKNTIFSGYIWEKYSHISPQYDEMTGMVDPLPVTSAGMLKINSNVSNEVIGKFEPIKQYYLWTKLEFNATKGIVTCKRKPSEITLDDIVGFYLVDCDGSIVQEYIGIENIRDKEREGWVSNISTTTSNYDTLELAWEEDGVSGIDTFGFVDELTDVDIDNGSSNNLEDYCFNFSNSGTITITLTNLGNYALRDDNLYPINLYGGTGKTFGFDLYKYGSNVSMSRMRVNTIGATQISGEQTSATVTFNVSSAGLYYVKCTIGTNIGTPSGYYFSMGTSDLGNYYPCDIICDWSLHVEATETMPDNMCVSVKDYLNYWYEKSGNDERFNPKYIDVNYFGQKFGWGNAIDKQQRVLWNNNNGSVPIEDVENFYPVKCASYCTVHTADVNDYDVPRLICVSDVPDFEIFKFGFNGTIKYPNNPSGTFLIDGTDMGRGTTRIAIDLTPIYWSDVFEPKEVCNAVDIHDIYYETGTYGDLTLSRVNLTFEVLTSFPWVYDSPYAGSGVTLGDSIPVSFSNGTKYFFSTLNTSNHKVIGYQPTFTLNLNDQWRQSTIFMSEKTIYESFSNYNVNSGTATMTIDIYGYKKFSLYIKSNAESNYDYVMVSQLDQSITGSTTYSNTTLVKAHTRGNQQTGNTLSNYTLVTYENIDGGSHTITIVYRKDSSQHSGADRGYVIIGDDTDEPYVEYLSTIHAKGTSTSAKLIDLGSITSIDYSNLKFKSTTSGGTIQQVEHYLNFMEYTLMTGIEGLAMGGVSLSGISLSSYDDEYEIYEYVGSFITLDGLGEYLTNVKFRILETFGENPVIAIKTSDLTSVFGKECYFRFPIRVKSTSGIIELCLRVSVTDTEFIIHNGQIGNCTIWLGSNYSNGVHGVYFVDQSNDTPLYLCPVKGSYLPQYFIGDGSITNTFAHGHLYEDENHISIRTIYYQGEFMYNGVLSDGYLFSFIPPNCTTISDLGTYVHNRMPYIEIKTDYM